MNNFEKVKSMTIDEMAVLLQHIIPCEICKNEDCSQSCNDGIRQSLRK